MKIHIAMLAFAATLSANQALDGQGALEGFYKPHHSHRKAWLTVGILIGSGVATGLLATRASRPPIGRPIMPAMPALVTPVFGGTSFIGIGGPGVPVVISKGGAN